MTPKTKEELAEEYSPVTWVQGIDIGTSARYGFLAGFQARNEEVKQLKELLLDCEAFLAKHSRDVDVLIQPEKSVIEASKLLQKIRMRE